MLAALEWLGRTSRETLVHIGNLTRMSWGLARALPTLPRYDMRILAKVAFSQVRFSGVHAVPIIGVIATLIGAVTIIQSFSILSGLADRLIGTLLVGLIARELAPLITAVVLIGRSGTAMATELASMNLNGEINTLAAHRIDPLPFVVLPRVIGAVLSMFALIAVFDLLGILGGFGVSVLLMDLSFAIVRNKVLAAVGNVDLVLYAAKSILFGTSIAGLSCYFGLRARRSSTELPQAVTKAVVSSLFVIFLIDSLLAVAVYLL